MGRLVGGELIGSRVGECAEILFGYGQNGFTAMQIDHPVAEQINCCRKGGPGKDLPVPKSIEGRFRQMRNGGVQ
jgi:hypothetical protein